MRSSSSFSFSQEKKKQKELISSQFIEINKTKELIFR